MKNTTDNHNRITMRKVADAANVSLVTVSRALRSPDLVNAETRKRILSVVDSLGYIRDDVAGSLASSRSGIVAVIVPSMNNAVFATTLQGLNNRLTAGGMEMMVGTSGLGLEHEERLVRALLGRRPDGFVLTGVSHSKGTRRMLRGAGIPVVETWNLTRRPIDQNIGFSNSAAMDAVTRHLIEKGRRRIAYIGGHLLGNDRAKDRRDGFVSAISAAELNDDLIFELPFPNAIYSVEETIKKALGIAPKLDGIVCSSDAFAFAAIYACQRQGLDVPGDIAVGGLGDIEMASLIRPTLTTARVRGEQMGERAAEAILSSLSGHKPKRKTIDLGFELTPREST